ncbi:uncharacterized protein LOC124148994 isoform X1 [Haliotis rufescens]|uniref:uncharacterized protein LOC124148994 isoform X1 n=1 Tax=Haliotis rufescens TaxID=6454 RepID=UPI00201EBB62|nr:uncharacterized protein LOC124148994 isoform X1 [Haliotis rufescens]
MSRHTVKSIFLPTLAITLVVLVYQFLWAGDLSTQAIGRIPTTSLLGKDRENVSNTVGQNTSGTYDKWLILSSFAEKNDIRVAGWRVLLLTSTTKSKSVCRSPWCVTWNTINTSHDAVEDGNRAYLYAISHGASLICLIHHLNIHVLEMLKRITNNLPQSGLVLMTNKTFFEPNMAPITTGNKSRNLLEEKSSFNEFYIEEHLNPLILSVFYPQMLKRHTGSLQEHDTYSKSISQHPPIFLPCKTFTSLSLDLMMFQYNAFWALPLMSVIRGDIIVQRVLWDVRGRTGIYPLSVELESDTLNTTSSKPLIDVLQFWQCKGDLDVLQCMSDLLKLLKENKLLTLRDIHLVDGWISDLRSIHYQLPKRTAQKRIIHLKKNLTAGIISLPTISTSMSKETKDILGTVCPKTAIAFPNMTINDIALIISFNEPSLYANIPILEAMYRPYFHSIIFCGPKINTFTSSVHKTSTGYFIYMELLKRGWYYMYECTVEAMKLNVDVKGFLQIGDDTLINPWNIDTLPRDKIWLHTGIRRENVSDKEINPWWMYWKGGKPRILAVIDEIRNMSKPKSTRSFVHRFLHNFQHNSNNFSNIFIQSCDFMYVPASFENNFTFVADLLLKHDVMMEIGFANIAHGLQMRKDIHFVKDGSLWDNRDKYMDVYNRKDIFLHPFKIKSYLSQESGRNFFCNTYLNVFNHTHD